MERLTERIDNVPDGESGVWVKNHDYISAAIKLADYEDLEELIGVPLEELARIFRQHIPDGCHHPKKAIVLTDGDVDKWRKYKDLEEQGRLVLLPCKDVYFIVDINNPKYSMVMKRSIRELAIYEIENIDKENCKYFSTEEKVKARLKELRGGENG
jgi:hypothetical protein